MNLNVVVKRMDVVAWLTFKHLMITNLNVIKKLQIMSMFRHATFDKNGKICENCALKNQINHENHFVRKVRFQC